MIAGGGSAGCVLATRLTENPNITLCVIEAGKRDRNPWIHIPLGFGKLVPNPKVNWGYETEPEPFLDGRRVSWPRGKVLGGSGSINGLVFLRGAVSGHKNGYLELRKTVKNERLITDKPGLVVRNAAAKAAAKGKK